MSTMKIAPIDPVLNALPPIYPAEMSYEERLKSIFAHEKAHSGIDWLGLYAKGPSGQAEAARQVQAHLKNFALQHNILDEQIA